MGSERCGDEVKTGQAGKAAGGRGGIGGGGVYPPFDPSRRPKPHFTEGFCVLTRPRAVPEPSRSRPRSIPPPRRGGENENQERSRWVQNAQVHSRLVEIAEAGVLSNLECNRTKGRNCHNYRTVRACERQTTTIWGQNTESWPDRIMARKRKMGRTTKTRTTRNGIHGSDTSGFSPPGGLRGADFGFKSSQAAFLTSRVRHESGAL